jgi:Tfp pilus assembly protein FimV
VTPDEGLPHGSTAAAPSHPRRFYTVVSGDTLFAIAVRFGWKPRDGQPAFRVMLDAFPANAPFREHPESIQPGQRVRVA